MSDYKNIEAGKKPIEVNTQEILNQLEAEETAKNPEPEKKPEPAPEPKPEEEKEEEKQKEPEGEKEESFEPRPIKAIPIAKYQEEKRKWKEKFDNLDGQIKELNQRLSTGTQSNDIDSIIKKYPDLDRELVESIVSIAETRASSKVALPEDVKKKLDAFEEANKEQFQNQMFEKELIELSREYPEATEAKVRLKELAFTEGYEKKSLFELYFRHVKPGVVEKKKTVESSKGSKHAATNIDFENVTDEVIDKMTPKQFEEYSQYMAKHHGSRLTVIK